MMGNSQHDQPEEPIVEQAPAEDQPAPVLVSEEEMLRRTAYGIAVWLTGAVVAFWVAVLGVLLGMLHVSQSLMVASYFLLTASLVVSLVLYLAVMLEATTFRNRRVRFWLQVSFGDLVFLTVIIMLARLFGSGGVSHFTPMTLLTFPIIAVAISVLVYAFYTNRRYFYLLAVVILLLANLMPVR